MQAFGRRNKNTMSVEIFILRYKRDIKNNMLYAWEIQIFASVHKRKNSCSKKF